VHVNHQTKLSPGKDHIIKDARDLEPAQFRRLVTRRARQIIDPSLGPATDEDTRRELEGRIEEHFEKIHKGADFLPARFLVDGAAKAGAVCRISTPTSYGTGFLVGRGYLMTNHHVLGSAVDAEQSVAEFGFEGDQPGKKVTIEPRRLFITNPELDFTIVACDEQALPDVEPIPLLRNPATVTRNERVNVIQHPRGRPKEVTLHDNRVTRIKDKVIHYRTDTEPGSSGSPVFNNDWDLIALHHAGWSEGNGAATNEGIRISAVVSHLLARTSESSADYEATRAVLGNITDTSPYLGFFDFCGVGEPGSLEVEVPDFTGTRYFADVGVWNIEHFNDRISDQRIEDVADVVARLVMDVLGLVEVERGALDRMVAALGRRGFSMGYELLDVSGSQDLAVLYDRDTTTVTIRQDIYDRHAALLNAKTPSGRTAFPRYPLFADCAVRNGEGRVKFLIIVVHLKAFGDVQSRARRRLAAEMLAKIIEDIRERERLAVVLSGDFNERLDADVLSELKASPDLFALTADDATTDAISYIGGSHRSLIDHVLVSRDVRLGEISGDDAAIVRLDRSIRDFAGRVSDHVPVVFRMIYRDEPIDVVPSPGAPGVNVLIPEGAARLCLGFE
jgi:V8-like Glu-specific endopeptidase/endonuclease/exonuclease/phosphatase family metal-dependent hydrolase